MIIDAPGHKEFLKNMISGAANAEAALLIIDALEGVQEQSKRHGYILSLLGIQKVYVIVNKMDLIDYSEDRFNKIKHEMNEFLNGLHVYPLRYIPISAFYGENLTHLSDKMPWYEGEPVLKAIDLFEKDKGLSDKPLRFPIQDVYKFDNRRIIAGRIESGTLRVGDEILISPGTKSTRVKTIEYWADRDKRDALSAGMSVGITVEDEFFNKRGELITHKKDSPLVSDTLNANLFWMGRTPLVRNKKYKLKLATQEVECEIHSISRVIDATTLEAIENAFLINTNDVAEITIKVREKICFDEFRNNQNIGRFVLVDGYDVSGGGIVTGLVKDLGTQSKFTKNGKEITMNCFDEFYFVIEEGTVKRVPGRPDIFEVGDIVPVTGDTYCYPEDFDLVDLKNRLAAKVRKNTLDDIISLRDYSYDFVPLIDVYGAYLKVNNKESCNTLLTEYESIEVEDENGLIAFANRWMDFIKFRQIKFSNSTVTWNAEYYI